MSKHDELLEAVAEVVHLAWRDWVARVRHQGPYGVVEDLARWAIWPERYQELTGLQKQPYQEWARRILALTESEGRE